MTSYNWPLINEYGRISEHILTINRSLISCFVKSNSLDFLKEFEKTIELYSYLSRAEIVSSFPFKSSNSIKSGRLDDSERKPVSGWRCWMYLTLYKAHCMSKETRNYRIHKLETSIIVQIIHTINSWGSALQVAELIWPQK